jgi:hypothetical protein
MRWLTIALLLPCAALAQDGGTGVLRLDGGEVRWQGPVDANDPDAGSVTLSFKPCSEPACGDPAFNRRYESVNPFISYSREPQPTAPKVKPKVSPPGSTLRVRVGETAFVTFACNPNALSFGNHPWDITPLGGGLASLRGFEPGKGSVYVRCSDDRRLVYGIEVSPAE